MDYIGFVLLFSITSLIVGFVFAEIIIGTFEVISIRQRIFSSIQFEWIQYLIVVILGVLYGEILVRAFSHLSNILFG